MSAKTLHRLSTIKNLMITLNAHITCTANIKNTLAAPRTLLFLLQAALTFNFCTQHLAVDSQSWNDILMHKQRAKEVREKC